MCTQIKTSELEKWFRVNNCSYTEMVLLYRSKFQLTYLLPQVCIAERNSET